VERYGGSDKIDPSILPTEMFEAQALRRVTLGLLVNALVEEESVEIDEERVREKIEEMAGSYEDPDQVIEFFSKDEQQQNQIRSMVLEEQVVDLLLARAVVEEKTMSYEEVLKSLQPEDASASD
jgi:trigger factor